MAILGHVADDRDDPGDLARRLDRIEELLRRAPSASVAAGPEVRSARSIVSRIDDVWVAVTEGNERVLDTIERLGAVRPGPTGGADHPSDAAGGPGGVDGPGPSPAEAVHLRLNRIEEALAGIAERIAAQDGGARTGAGPDGGAEVAAAVRHLDAEVRRLAQRVDALAHAIEASATRSADGTLTDRLGRLRDQFRR
ncbi:MAG TPA: hypothetical protein VHM89_07910 [Acidimicrobiales bacterium]|nr:hypothetical protein [Acidimicrobiales bacterium]